MDGAIFDRDCLPDDFTGERKAGRALMTEMDVEPPLMNYRGGAGMAIFLMF